MKYLILSDTHGRRDRLREIWQRHRDADGLVFLGDGVADLHAIEEISCPIYAVRGNCDIFSMQADAFCEEQWMHMGEYTVLLMHGHRHGVKQNEETAAIYAASRGADLLLFGHTHQPLERYYPQGELPNMKKPLYLFNPGSSGMGSLTFGTLCTSKKGLLFSHGKI